MKQFRITRETVEIKGKTYIRVDDLNINELARLQLLDLLNEVIKEAATPEMLEASAKVAEVLLKY